MILANPISLGNTASNGILIRVHFVMGNLVSFKLTPPFLCAISSNKVTTADHNQRKLMVINQFV